MSFGGLIHATSRYDLENLPLQPASAADATRPQFASKPKHRTVLGVLNEQVNRELGQGAQTSKLGGKLDVDYGLPSGQINILPSCASSSVCFDVYVDELSDLLPSPTSTMVVNSQSVVDAAVLQHRDFRLFLDLSSGSCMDASMQSQPGDDLELPDIFTMVEYSEDIYLHLREGEVRSRPRPGYMKKQPDINNCMRLILVDWLVEVGEEYNLCSETLHLAVNYMDRFLSCMSVLREKLQLVGTAAMLIAAKYEEVYPPDVDEFVYITDDTYTKKQLLRMEHLLLKVLAFGLTVPTAHQFLRQFMTVESVCSKTENLALYLAELSLLEVDPFLQYSSSKIAAAAYCLSNYTLNRTLWPCTLQAFTGYTMAEIMPCLQDLHKLYLSAASRPQQAMQEKYKSSKYCSVSQVPPLQSIPLPRSC